MYVLKILWFVVSDLTSLFREDQASIALNLYEHSKGDSVRPSLKMFSNILGTFHYHILQCLVVLVVLFVSFFSVLARSVLATHDFLQS